MEEKFCLKSRKELDEIRESKKQVNEISDNLVGRTGRKIDQQYYQAKGEEIEAADAVSRGTGDMGTLIKASQKADNKLARASRFWKLADKRKARKQVGESKINEGVTKSNYNEIIKTLSDTLAKAAKENPDARLVKNYQATTGSTGVYFDEGLHFRGKGAVLKAVSVSEKLQEAMKKYDFKLFRSDSMSYKLGNDKASSIISFGVESQGDNGATVGYNIKKDNLKFLESKINEGVHGVKVLEATKEAIKLVVEFDNGKEETNYYVECYLLVGEDEDIFSIQVYDGIHSNVNPTGANEVMHGLFDTDGGSFDGMEVEIGENGYNFEYMGELEDLILDVLFNKRNGIVTNFDYSKNESKINEISDETVYNAVAKAQDRALKSLRKDSDKRNFLRDADKLNNIYNAGLRREWRKKGLKNPVGMSAKQLGKVWDKKYEPVKAEYENQLKKRHKVDAFGNEKSESLKENWQYELNGDEFVTLKDGREGTLGGLVYDKNNNFIGYEFSTNPYGGYEYEEIKPEDIASLAESKINEGAGSAVIFEFEKADFNIPRVEDKQVIAEVEDLTLASAYDRGEAPNGGFVVFDLDDIKNTIVDAYNQYDRFVEDPEITVEDIADVKYVSVEHMPNLSYSWGWSRIELPKDVVLTWDKHQVNGYLPSLEVGFTDKQGEEHTATTVIVDGEYHISEDVYYAYQDLDNYEDEEYDESLTAEKALAKSKTILEEYGEYQDDPNFEEIARQLEQGNTYGSTYETEWGEVEINGTPISDLLKTDEVIDWVLRELSYPVRDGHAYYNGLDCIFYSYGDTIDHTNEDVIADLVALGFDETEIREMPVIKDPADVKEIETWIDYDINYKEPEEDEEYDESLTEAKVKPETLKAQLEEEIKKFFKYEPDALDWAFVEITKEEGRTRVEVRAELDYNGMWALSDALDPIVQKYDKDAYFDQEQPGIMTAYIENKKGLGERKTCSHRRKAIVEAKSKKMPKGDLILKLVHQVTKNDKGESAHVKYDWDKKEYNIEDQDTGEIIVSGKPSAIIKWAESKGAKQPAKEPGFAIDGAETLDQVYARNWNRAMSKMAKNESKIDENKRWDSFAGHSLPNGDRDDYEETTKKEPKSMVIPFSFKNPDQYSPADRINHKLVITKEQNGTFSWSESSNDESGKGFKSAREAFDNAVSTGEFPLEDYDGFQLDAEVDLAAYFNESKISESAESNWEHFESGLALADRYIQLTMPIVIDGMDLDLVAWIFRNKENAKSKYGFELFVDAGADSTIIEDGNYNTVSEVIADCLSAIKEFDERNNTDIIYDVKPLEPNEADMAFLEKSV